MQWGGKIDMLEKMKEQGQDPPALRNRPRLLDRLQWYFECFTDMTGDRSYTQGYPLRLSTSQIHAYWQIYGLYAMEDFIDKIKMIDSIWITKQSEKHEKESKQKEAPKGSAPPRLSP